MPPFPERESSLLAKLKKKKGAVDKDEKELEPPAPAAQPATQAPQPVSHAIIVFRTKQKLRSVLKFYGM